MDSNEQRNHSRFTFIFVALALITATLVYAGYTTLKQELFAEQVVVNQSKTEALAVRVDRWLSTRKTEISALANTPVIRAMDWSQSGPFLKAKHEAYPWFYIFAQINPDGTYYNSKVDYAEGQNLADRAHFKASIAGNVYASDPVVSRTLGTDIVAVTSPVYQSDQANAEIIGVFGGMIDTSTIVDELSRFTNGPNSYAFAVNSSGIAISHPDEARRGNINTKAVSLLEDSDVGLSTAVKTMLSGERGWQRVNIDGQDAYITYTPISEANWYIATVTDAAYVNGQFVIVDYASGIVALLVAAVLFMIWRSRRQEVDLLNQQRQIFAEKSQAKSVFLANMSHELRTPLNAIIGYSQILSASPKLDADSRKTLSLVLNSGRHLLMLINRVLDLSKIEAGKLELDQRPINPRNLFNELIQIFEVERAKYSVNLSAEIANDLPQVVSIDPEKLTQILTNIVVNAFKYGAGSPVQLDVQHDPGAQSLVIKVEDRGPGMTQEQLGLLFTPFERVNAKSDGAGLGMSIVKELVELMSGQVYVDSELGRGTRITINLPYEQAEDGALALTDRAVLPSKIRGDVSPRLLIVDDNTQNRQFLRYMLEPLGFVIVEAEDGLQAQRRMQDEQLDLIITDLVMPNMDGFEFISWVRQQEQWRDLPIIVASASAFNDDQIRSLSLGADAFMPKPLDVLELLGRVARLCKIEYEEAVDLTPAETDREILAISIDWSDPANIELRSAMINAATLGQLQKIEQLIASIEDETLRQQWRRLLSGPLNDQDDEKILEVLEAENA